MLEKILDFFDLRHRVAVCQRIIKDDEGLQKRLYGQIEELNRKLDEESKARKSAEKKARDLENELFDLQLKYDSQLKTSMILNRENSKLKTMNQCYHATYGDLYADR